MSAVPPKQWLVPPLGSDAVWAAGWTPQEARLAVDQFKRGSTMRWAWQLAIDATSYPPIKAALEQRLAIPSGLPWTVEGGDRAPARIEREAAEEIWTEHLERLVDSTLIDVAMLGLCVWHHPLVVDPETLRTSVAPYFPGQIADMTLSPPGVPVGGIMRWPLSAVGYTPYPLRGVIGYYAIAQGAQFIQLPRPGTTSSEWTVIGTGKGGDQPHLRGAVVALDMPFTAGMLALRARSNLGVSAGRASPVGNLPPGVPMRTTDDKGNPVRGIAEDAADTLAAMGTEQTAALFPDGMKIAPFELTTTGAAAYFHGDLMDSLLMVALAILNHGGSIAKTDAQYRSEGGREVDVPESLNRRDVNAFERGANGLFAMLAKLNAGLPPARAPKLNGHLPDADQAERIKAKQEQDLREGEKIAKAHNAVAVERANGFDFQPTPEGQARLDAIFRACGCKDSPTIPTKGLPPALVKLPTTETTLTPETALPLPPPPVAPPASAP